MRWSGRAVVRLRGGGSVLSQLSHAPLEAELGAAKAALEATQKAARKARREARRREAMLQAELDALEAARPAAAAAPSQVTSYSQVATPPTPHGCAATRAFRVLNSAALLACALGLGAAPSRCIGMLLEVDLGGKGVGFLSALLARTTVHCHVHAACTASPLPRRRLPATCPPPAGDLPAACPPPVPTT